MARVNNLKDGNLGEAKRQQRRDQYSTPLNGSSVGHGGQRFYGTGRLTVQNEGLFVTGVASIAGTLSVDGTSRFSGQTFIYGPLEVTGSTILDGPTDVGGAFTVTGETKLNGNTTVGGNLELVSGGLFKAGATEIRPDGSAKFGLFDIAANGNLRSKGMLDIEGVTTLKADLNVTTGGKIKAGGMTIDPAEGGKISFPSNQYIKSTDTRLVGSSLHLQGTLEVENAVVFKGLQSTQSDPNVYYNPTTGVLYYKI